MVAGGGQDAARPVAQVLLPRWPLARAVPDGAAVCAPTARGDHLALHEDTHHAPRILAAQRHPAGCPPSRARSGTDPRGPSRVAACGGPTGARGGADLASVRTATLPADRAAVRRVPHAASRPPAPRPGTGGP